MLYAHEASKIRATIIGATAFFSSVLVNWFFRNYMQRDPQVIDESGKKDKEIINQKEKYIGMVPPNVTYTTTTVFHILAEKVAKEKSIDAKTIMHFQEIQ